MTDRQPTPGPTILDWSGRDGVRHWGGGRTRSCRSCGQPAFLVDDHGAPQHKVCAEAEADAAKTTAAAARQRDRETPRPERAARARAVPEREAEVLW